MMRSRLIYHPDIFACTCRECMAGYFAWCDSDATAVDYDKAKWARYESINPWLVAESQTRGYITFGDLLACGHSVNDLRSMMEVKA